MAKTNPSAIVLKESGEALYKEHPLAALDACGNGAITPGMLCELNNGEIRPHSTATGLASPIRVAVEGLNMDATSLTMGDVDTDYDDDGCAVKTWYPKPGSEWYALLAAGETVAIHGLLESHGDGYLQAGTTNPVARALEAKNNAAGSHAVRVKVEVLS